MLRWYNDAGRSGSIGSLQLILVSLCGPLRAWSEKHFLKANTQEELKAPNWAASDGFEVNPWQGRMDLIMFLVPVLKEGFISLCIFYVCARACMHEFWINYLWYWENNTAIFGWCPTAFTKLLLGDAELNRNVCHPWYLVVKKKKKYSLKQPKDRNKNQYCS